MTSQITSYSALRRPTSAGQRILQCFSWALLCACAPAWAHDYWFEHEGKDYVLYQGHRYSAHQGEERVPYEPSIVQHALCLNERGEVMERPHPATYPARFTGPCAAFVVQASSGYWSQSLTGTVNKPKTEVFGALRGWLSEESVKQIDAWSPRLLAAITSGLELVPLENPLTRRVDDKLHLLASWEGKPKAGVTVAYDGEPRGVTGADGRVNIRLRHGGIQIIAASFEEPLKDPKADKIVRGTILQFRIE
jgi:nickel transport protein